MVRVLPREKIYTQFDLPLVESSTSIWLVIFSHNKLVSLEWIDKSKIIATSDEIAIKLQTCSYSPCDIETLEVFEAIVFSNINISIRQSLLMSVLAESKSTLQSRSRVENKPGVLCYSELILPIHRDFELMVVITGVLARVWIGADLLPVGTIFAKGIVDCNGITKTLNECSVIYSTKLETIVDGRIELFFHAYIGRIESCNRLCETRMNSYEL